MKHRVFAWVCCCLSTSALSLATLSATLPSARPAFGPELVRSGGGVVVEYGMGLEITGSECGGIFTCYDCGGHGCECTDRPPSPVPWAPGAEYDFSDTVTCSGFYLYTFPGCKGSFETRAGDCPYSYSLYYDP